jgi:hypothetical protein
VQPGLRGKINRKTRPGKALLAHEMPGRLTFIFINESIEVLARPI